MTDYSRILLGGCITPPPKRPLKIRIQRFFKKIKTNLNMKWI